MSTITINTYDPAGRFDFDTETAGRFFKYVEEQAKAQGYDVEFYEAISVDSDSEEFVSECFQEFDPEA